MNDPDIDELDRRLEQYINDHDHWTNEPIRSTMTQYLKTKQEHIRRIFQKYKSYDRRKKEILNYCSDTSKTFIPVITATIPKRYADEDLYEVFKNHMHESLLYYFEQTPEMCLDFIHIYVADYHCSMDEAIEALIPFFTIPIEGEFLRNLNKLKLCGKL